MQNVTVDTLGIFTVNELNRGLVPMFQALEHHDSLRHLTVAVNCIGTESVVFLMNGLKALWRLETLDLSFLA